MRPPLQTSKKWDQSGEGAISEAGAEPAASAESRSGDNETTDEADPAKVAWKTTDRLPIQDRMIEVINLTKTVAEQELEMLRRKLRKMQLGS